MSFYCTKISGDPDFSIDEWNREFNKLHALGLQMPKPDTSLCKEQCHRCMDIIIDHHFNKKKP